MQQKLVFDLIPTPENNRNSEGSFLRAPNGDILFAYSRYATNDLTDHAPCDIAMVRSSDEGETWSAPVIIVRAEQFGVDNVMSVSGLPLRDGSLCFWFLIKENDGTVTIGRAVSADGLNFTAERCDCRFPRAYYVVNNDRAIRLADGRVAFPAARHDGFGPLDPKYHLGPASDLVFLSDDDGKTLYASQNDVRFDCPANRFKGLQEPGVYQKKDGSFYLWARTDLGRQYEFFSDDLNVFTVPRPSEFTGPCSPLELFEDGDDLYAVYNPVPRYNGSTRTEWGWGRTPLVIRKSTDDGGTWGALNVIEDDPDRGYCYPALFATNDGCLLVSYCRGGREDGVCLARLGIMKIKKESIEQ